MSHCPRAGGATYPLGPCLAQTGAKVYRDETQLGNNPPFLKGRIHMWPIQQGHPFRKAYENIVSDTEIAAEISLASEPTPNLCSLAAAVYFSSALPSAETVYLFLLFCFFSFLLSFLSSFSPSFLSKTKQEAVCPCFVLL